ncbi:N-formylglutamate amidohydrolase [Paremcibacter congregatus]|uniref:N-formylglutamate amidohydrolase n=1 Tax=Paremcibacter congregatus TaxID=2043170 RepID=UPI0030EDB8B8|tara:strand:- start:32112 stop:32903 length:792 start_codon:yes stop_codon:yes gene_type:complete
MSQTHHTSSDYGPRHAYEVINATGKADIVFICEHASNYIPPEYENLGLDEDFLAQHIAWDIGMEQLTRHLAERLDAPAIIATFSRLLIDPNREEDHATLIPLTSDGISIPGNQNMSPAEIDRRRTRYYQAFHDRADEMVQAKIATNHAPLVCGMHSFTPQMGGFDRPWQAGMLWNKDPRLAQALINSLSARGFQVGDNEPYSGRDLFFTMNQHGDRHGTPHVTLEIRQDEVGTPAGIVKWADILVEDLTAIAQDTDVRSIKRF